jgi:hypothetical protein
VEEVEGMGRLEGRFEGVVAGVPEEGFAEVFEGGGGEVDGLPARAAEAAARGVAGDGDHAEAVPGVFEGEDFGEETVLGWCGGGVGEDEGGFELVAEEGLPGLEGFDVLAGDPALETARSPGAAGGVDAGGCVAGGGGDARGKEAAALDVDEEVAAGEVDDKVEGLEGGVVREEGLAGLVDADVGGAAGAEIGLESAFGVVAELAHGVGGEEVRG